MPDKTVPFVVEAGQGSTIEGPAGGPLEFKARSEQTGGSLMVLENVIAPGDGPPLHWHTDTDESWYIIEGRLRFKLGDDIRSAPAGSFVFVPRGTHHCFQNVADGPARILVIFSPAGMESFFEDFASLPEGPIDQKVYGEIASRAGMIVAGPPLAISEPI
jgi:quercetin dioxygenase-like cupin family protein